MRHLIVIALIAAGTVHARRVQAGPHEISIGPSTRTLRTSSANALTSDSLSGGAVGYAHALGINLIPGLALWADVTAGWGGADGTLFKVLSTKLDTLSVTVGGRARYPLRSHVTATARLDLGLARANVTIGDDDGHTASDHGWGATSQAALGLELHVIQRSRFALGARFELGYVAASPIDLVTMPASNSDMLQLEMTSTSIGRLNLSGAVFVASVMSEF